MTISPRKTESLFPDTTAGLLSKAQTLTRLCPHKDEWRCPMGFIEYKLAPAAGRVNETVIDLYIDWLREVRDLMEAGQSDSVGWDHGTPTVAQVEHLMSLVVDHLKSL
jgi:hypothetical protein